MTAKAKAFAEAACQLVGTPFRLRGRDPRTGLDCLGLVHSALCAIGHAPPTLPRYTLRNTAITELLDLLPEAGFTPTLDDHQAGDLHLLRPSAGQFHLAIAADPRRLVHAHAGLGRVVLTPRYAMPEPQARWRLT